MTVHVPTARREHDRLVVSSVVEPARQVPGLPDRIWFSVAGGDDDLADYAADCCAAALVPLAMALGEPVDVRGHVSGRLAGGIEEYQRVLEGWFPRRLRRVPVLWGGWRSAPEKEPEGVGAAFSGGVDSLYTLWSHLRAAETDPASRISHGVFLHGFDIPLCEERSYTECADAYEAFLRSHGIRLARVATNAREFALLPGWDVGHGAVLAGAALLLGAWLRRFHIWVRSLDAPFEAIEPAVEVRHRWASREDLPQIADAGQRRESRELGRRLDLGCECLIGVHGGRVVFSVWLRVGSQYPEVLNRALDPGPGCGYIFDSATLPALRGKRIAPAGWALACGRARELGCSRVIGWVEVRNEASRRTIRRIGFTPRWRAVRLSFLGHQWFRCSPLPLPH